MKNYQIILAIVTVVVLEAVDRCMVGVPAYGWAFRGVVWLIMAVNVIVFWEGVRAYAAQEDA